MLDIIQGQYSPIIIEVFDEQYETKQQILGGYEPPMTIDMFADDQQLMDEINAEHGIIIDAQTIAQPEKFGLISVDEDPIYPPIVFTVCEWTSDTGIEYLQNEGWSGYGGIYVMSCGYSGEDANYPGIIRWGDVHIREHAANVYYGAPQDGYLENGELSYETKMTMLIEMLDALHMGWHTFQTIH